MQSTYLSAASACTKRGWRPGSGTSAVSGAARHDLHRAAAQAVDWLAQLTGGYADAYVDDWSMLCLDALHVTGAEAAGARTRSSCRAIFRVPHYPCMHPPPLVYCTCTPHTHTELAPTQYHFPCHSSAPLLRRPVHDPLPRAPSAAAAPSAPACLRGHCQGLSARTAACIRRSGPPFSEDVRLEAAAAVVFIPFPSGEARYQALGARKY